MMASVQQDGVTFGDWMQATQSGVESRLDQFLPAADTVPHKLHAAMRYALLGGGKPDALYRFGPVAASAGTLSAGASDAVAATPQALAKAESGWVLDGNYSRTKTIKWESVDWVVWVDYGFCRTLFQAVRRAATRAWQGTELWPGTGNRESFRRSFFSRDSIVLWTIKTYRKNRAGYLADMNDARYRHIRFIQLRSPAQTARFIRALPRQ